MGRRYEMPKLSLISIVNIMSKFVLLIFITPFLWGCFQPSLYNADGQSVKHSSYRSISQDQQFPTEGVNKESTGFERNTFGVNLPDLPPNTEEQQKKDK